MFDDEDEDESSPFEWTSMHILNTYAWKAAQGAFPYVPVGLGLNIIDAIKLEHLDDATAQPYIEIFGDAVENKRAPKWE